MGIATALRSRQVLATESLPSDTYAYPEAFPDVTGLSLIMPNGTAARSGSGGGMLTHDTRTWTRTCLTPPVSVRLMISSITFGLNGEGSLPSKLTVQAALELRTAVDSGGGPTVPFKFRGKQKLRLRPGQVVVSDPITAADMGVGSFPAATQYFVRISETLDDAAGSYLAYLTGGSRPSSGAGEYVRSFNPPGSTQVYGTGPLTSQAGGIATIRGLTHLGLLGAWNGTPLPSLLYTGDSIANGSNDANWTTGATGGGYCVRAAHAAKTNGIPAIHMCSASSNGLDNLPNARLRKFLARVVTHILDEFGVNDISQGWSPQDLYAAKKTFYAGCRAQNPSVKIIATTIGPRSNSTDGFATVINQTPFANFQPGGNCDIFYALLNSEVGGAGPDVVLDTRAAFGDPGNPYAWVANTTADGLHPNSIGHGAAAAPLLTYLNSQ